MMSHHFTAYITVLSWLLTLHYIKIINCLFYFTNTVLVFDKYHAEKGYRCVDIPELTQQEVVC